MNYFDKCDKTRLRIRPKEPHTLNSKLGDKVSFLNLISKRTKKNEREIKTKIDTYWWSNQKRNQQSYLVSKVRSCCMMCWTNATPTWTFKLFTVTRSRPKISSATSATQRIRVNVWMKTVQNDSVIQSNFKLWLFDLQQDTMLLIGRLSINYTIHLLRELRSGKAMY